MRSAKQFGNRMLNITYSGQWLKYIYGYAASLAIRKLACNLASFRSIPFRTNFRSIAIPPHPPQLKYTHTHIEMTSTKLNAISMAKEKVFILIFSWHFKLWPCSVHIYLCFVYFIYASLHTSSHPHTRTHRTPYHPDVYRIALF